MDELFNSKSVGNLFIFITCYTYVLLDMVLRFGFFAFHKPFFIATYTTYRILLLK